MPVLLEERRTIRGLHGGLWGRGRGGLVLELNEDEALGLEGRLHMDELLRLAHACGPTR